MVSLSWWMAPFADNADAILTEDVEPLTLRVSGQLMLGVVRIYGRKVQYLMDDCKEMRERITMAFRPGMVDLPQDQIRASKNSITFTELAPNVDMIDILDWSFQVPTADYAPSANRGLNTAPPNQTNLRSREFGAFNFGRPAVLSIYGDGSSRQGSPFGSSTSHLDSQDFTGVDLGLNLEEWDESMEIGRDAQRSRSKSTTLSMRGSSVVRDDHAPMDTDNFGVEDDFNPVDLDLGLDDLPELTSDGPAPDAAVEEPRDVREASTLSTPPPESPRGANLTIDVSPRTAKRIAEAQQHRPKRVRVVRADEELELPDDEFAPPKDDDSEILGVERFIPADPEAVRLRDIIDDPAAHFLPTIKIDDETVIFAGPDGLAPELAELFTFPVNVLRRNREPEPERPHKRARSMTSELSELEDDPMEEARRQSRLPSEAGFEPDFGVGFEPDMSLDFGGLGSPPPGDADKLRAPSLAPSIAQSIAQSIRSAREAGEEGECKLMIFDPRVSASQMTSGSEETQRDAGGVSKSTGMAMGLLRAEIEAIAAEDKVVSFDELSRGASKRAASTGFFELLVLATRDCVKLEQKKAFGDIHIRAKDRLWEATPMSQSQAAA